MKNELIKIFKPTPKTLTLNDIKDALGYKNITKAERQHIDKNLQKLELDGKVYYDFINNCYYIFPSNFFVSKIYRINDGVITFGVNGKYEKAKLNNNEAKKKDFIVVKKENDSYKLVKIIGKPEELENIEDLEKIYSLFNPYSASFTFKELLKMTKSSEDELNNVLKELENEGILYLDNEDEHYKTMPSNYFVTTAEATRKGFYNVTLNGIIYNLPLESTNGILPFDKVLLKKEGKNISLVKIIKRTLPDVVCEVVDEKTIKVVGNTNINIRCTEEFFKNLHLPIGTRFIGSVDENEINNIYNIHFNKVIGHKYQVNAEQEAIVINNGFKVHYSKEEDNQAYKTKTTVTEEDKIGRVDLTNRKIFTIDGAGTKDMDDAVSITKKDNGNYLLDVHISHVSHYIPINSPLFLRAVHNTTSVYLANKVVHMLHPQISNGICSLNPNEERLTKTYQMEIDPRGNIVDFNYFDSVIKSRKKMTYEECNEIFENNKIPDGYEDYVNDLLLMQELAQIIENRRRENGCLDFGNKEIEFILDDEDKIIGVTTRSQGPAEKLIENFMVVTNEALAEFMYNLGIEFVYRNHEIPYDDKVKETVKLITQIGYKVDSIKNGDDPHVIQRIIDSLSTKEEFFILSSLLLRSMQKAYFSTENKGHYGLALNAYSQTTSPIRRLMDLIIEYILDNLDKILDGTINMDKLKSTLNSLCQRASMMERCADKAEYESNKLNMIDYVLKHQDLEYTAYIQDITPRYMVIKTKELIEGIVYFEDILDGFYEYNPECRWLENPHTKHRITIGSKLNLQFKEADREYRILKFYATTLTKENILARKKD